MATRSKLYIQINSKYFLELYRHYDGYFEGAGKDIEEILKISKNQNKDFIESLFFWKNSKNNPWKIQKRLEKRDIYQIKNNIDKYYDFYNKKDYKKSQNFWNENFQDIDYIYFINLKKFSVGYTKFLDSEPIWVWVR